jgi:hypothetical protein
MSHCDFQCPTFSDSGMAMGSGVAGRDGDEGLVSNSGGHFPGLGVTGTMP